MTIAELQERSKAQIGRIPKEMLILAVLILSATASFGLGILAGRDFTTQGQGSDTFEISQIATSTLPAGGQVVASKTGTKYFLPWCGGANQISDAHKVWFASPEEAEAKGYSPAQNCKGL